MNCDVCVEFSLAHDSVSGREAESTASFTYYVLLTTVPTSNCTTETYERTYGGTKAFRMDNCFTTASLVKLITSVYPAVAAV